MEYGTTYTKECRIRGRVQLWMKAAPTPHPLLWSVGVVEVLQPPLSAQVGDAQLQEGDACTHKHTHKHEASSAFVRVNC